jgi:phage protein D
MISGTDYYSSLAPFNLALSYSDNIGKADDLQLELHDIERRFIADSFPLKGAAKIEVAILCMHWRFTGDNQTLDCGLFEIDDVSFKGPPNRVSIKANSIPHSSTVKGENKTRAWEGKSLNQIVEEIAGENQLEVEWDTEENPRFKRIDQNDQSDLEFIQKQADETGLVLKIKRGSIKVFSEKEYELKEPAFTLRYGGAGILTWGFSTKTADTAKEAEVEFLDPETGKLTKAKATDKDPKLKNTRKIRRYDNPHSDPDLLPDPRAPAPRADVPPLIDADYYDNTPDKNKGKGAGLQSKAAKKAQADLRKANRHRDTAQFEVVGNPLAQAGQIVLLEDWGEFSGKYFLESVSHKISPYRTTYSMHRELASKGY